MSSVAVLGASPALAGFALAGALAVAAETPDEVVAAWEHLPADVALVVLAPAAGAVLAERPEPAGRLRVVMPA